MMYRNFYKKLEKINSVIMTLEEWVCVIMFAFLIFCLVAQVVFRFIIKLPSPWTEELARYSFIACMYLACGYTLHMGKHVDMNLIDSLLNKTRNKERTFFIMSKITMAANMVFCGLFMSMYYPFLMALKSKGKLIKSLPIPMWVIMSAVLVGFALMFWHSLVLFLKPMDDKNEAEGKESEA